tara:strand:+ start:1209 stop:1901 length:693 start_codon:yes stop_codon:yes gene_type:complete
MIRKLFLILFLYSILLYFYTWRNLLVIKDNSQYHIKYLYKDNIKSGDIFLLGNTKRNKIIGDLFFMVNFVHPSIAVWENNNLYILEFAMYPTKEGFIKIPFEEWIYFNKNKNILHSCLNTSVPEREKIRLKMINFFEKNKKRINKKNKNFDITWLRFPLRIKRQLNINNISCTEVLTELLYYAGIVKKNKGTSYYHQSDFIGLKGFKLKKQFSYTNNYLCNFQHLMKKYL